MPRPKSDLRSVMVALRPADLDALDRIAEHHEIRTESGGLNRSGTVRALIAAETTRIDRRENSPKKTG